jgi:SH3-like domain-containing protein
MLKPSILFFILTITLNSDCHSNEIGVATGLPLNRYVSFKSTEIKLRVGPGKKYQTSYIYQCKNCPVKIIAEFDHWRKIEDSEGTQGWVHQSLLSGVNYAVVKSNDLTATQKKTYNVANHQSLIFRTPNENHNPIAKIELHTIVKVIKCDNDWCKTNVNSITGWIKKINLWGVE